MAAHSRPPCEGTGEKERRHDQTFQDARAHMGAADRSGLYAGGGLDVLQAYARAGAAMERRVMLQRNHLYGRCVAL